MLDSDLCVYLACSHRRRVDPIGIISVYTICTYIRIYIMIVEIYNICLGLLLEKTYFLFSSYFGFVVQSTFISQLLSGIYRNHHTTYLTRLPRKWF